MSAQCNAAGLYSERPEWQPIPIHTTGDQGNCRIVVRMSDQYLDSDENKALLAKYKDLRKFLEINSGSRVRSVSDFTTLNDVLNVEYENGLP